MLVLVVISLKLAGGIDGRDLAGQRRRYKGIGQRDCNHSCCGVHKNGGRDVDESEFTTFYQQWRIARIEFLSPHAQGGSQAAAAASSIGKRTLSSVKAGTIGAVVDGALAVRRYCNGDLTGSELACELVTTTVTLGVSSAVTTAVTTGLATVGAGSLLTVALPAVAAG